MNVGAIKAITSLSFKEALRAKWLISFTLVFFLLAINVPELTLLALGTLPANYVESYLALLVTLSFPYLPLLALPIGSTSVVEDRESGSLQYLLSTPMAKMDFLLGRLFGLFVATNAVIVGGYTIAAFAAYNFAVGAYSVFSRLVLIAVLYNTAMLAIALLLSILSRRKATALGAAIFVWFLMSLITDISSTGIILSVVKSPLLVLPMVLLNPVQTSSVLAILQLDLPNSQIGIALAVKNVLGQSVILTLASSLLVWISLLLITAFFVFKRQDVD